MKKVEIENLNNEEETRFEITPDFSKCFQSKITGHKFIHTKTGKGLPLFVSKNEIELYNEVNI